MAWLPSPGPGPYPTPLDVPAYYALVLLLGCFVAMLWFLWHEYPRHKRALEGFFEAAGVDLAFLVFAVALVTAVGLHDSSGNRTSRALYEVVLTGYWLTFSIPVITVGSSVERRSRGSVAWLVPAVLVCAVLFLILFGYYYGHP
jgi:hypothetical protein